MFHLFASRTLNITAGTGGANPAAFLVSYELSAFLSSVSSRSSSVDNYWPRLLIHVLQMVTSSTCALVSLLPGLSPATRISVE